MPILALIPYLIQLLLIIHCIKTGRSGWLWLIVFLPYIGGIVYIIMNVIPDIKESRIINNFGDSLDNTFRPNNKIITLQKLVKKQETITNIIALADAYSDAGNQEEALKLYNECLSGPYEHDSEIEFRIVKTYLKSENYDEAKKALNRYKENNTIDGPEQKITELIVNQNYDKIKDSFESTGNFELAYELAKYYKKNDRIEDIKDLISELNEQRSDYPILKKGQNAVYYKKIKLLTL